MTTKLKLTRKKIYCSLILGLTTWTVEKVMEQGGRNELVELGGQKFYLHQPSAAHVRYVVLTDSHGARMSFVRTGVRAVNKLLDSTLWIVIYSWQNMEEFALWIVSVLYDVARSHDESMFLTTLVGGNDSKSSRDLNMIQASIIRAYRMFYARLDARWTLAMGEGLFGNGTWEQEQRCFTLHHIQRFFNQGKAIPAWRAMMTYGEAPGQATAHRQKRYTRTAQTAEIWDKHYSPDVYQMATVYFWLGMFEIPVPGSTLSGMDSMEALRCKPDDWRAPGEAEEAWRMEPSVEAYMVWQDRLYEVPEVLRWRQTTSQLQDNRRMAEDFRFRQHHLNKTGTLPPPTTGKHFAIHSGAAYYGQDYRRANVPAPNPSQFTGRNQPGNQSRKKKAKKAHQQAKKAYGGAYQYGKGSVYKKVNKKN